jgi:hypothetical protein
LSASDIAVVPAPPAVLVTSTTEIVGDSTIGDTWIFLPNASWPEAFLTLSDVVGGGGALLMKKRPQSNNNRRAET